MRLGLVLAVVLAVAAFGEAKKKKAKKESLFDTKTLNCLVCKALVEEVEAMINMVDPKKKVETGTWRLSGGGDQEGRKLVSGHQVILGNCSILPPRFRSRDRTSTFPMLWTRCARGSRTTRRRRPRPAAGRPSSG
jgi:hypothetical protein